MSKPSSVQTVKNHFPAVIEAHGALHQAALAAGPLDGKTCELIVIGAFTVARQEGGFKAHTNRALSLGATKEEVLQAIAVTMSLAATMEQVADAILWAEEVFASK